MDKVILYISKIRLHYLAVEAKNMLLILMIALFGSVMITGAEASALGYQNNVGVSFTFEPVLAINLSSNALIIPNLTPGSSAYSNTITINVATNNIAGYTLSAKVGDGNTYTNDKLTNASSSTVFDNLSSSSNLTLSQFNDNVWGYALGTIDSNTTYSGLVYNTDTVINATTNNTGTAASSGCVSTCAGTNSTNFTIAAKASATQAYGDYSNVIIFTVVGNVVDLPGTYVMQDVATWKNSLSVGDEVQATDSRDGKVYYVAKLADGNIWMTQNLDHDIGDITGGTYTSSDTDLLASTSWTPSASEETYATSDTTWNYSYTEPESYDPGDLCWTENLNTNWNGTLATETESCTQDGNHYHIGNYYNWTAAVAMSDSSSYEDDGDDVNQSICPAGWMLPKSGNTLTGSGSFINLLNEYGYSNYTLSGYTAWGEPLRLALGGHWYGDSNRVANIGYFLSSVVNLSNYAYALVVGAGGGVAPQDYGGRGFGNSVRCVAR